MDLSQGNQLLRQVLPALSEIVTTLLSVKWVMAGQNRAFQIPQGGSCRKSAARPLNDRRGSRSLGPWQGRLGTSKSSTENASRCNADHQVRPVSCDCGSSRISPECLCVVARKLWFWMGKNSSSNIARDARVSCRTKEAKARLAGLPTTKIGNIRLH